MLDHFVSLAIFLCIKIYEVKPYLNYRKISIHDIDLKICMSMCTLFIRPHKIEHYFFLLRLILMI
jgi:hypothetical protein